MEKLITRRNLLILNVVLSVAFMLLALRIVLAVVGGEENRIFGGSDLTVDASKKLAQTRPKRLAYNIISDNDLFVFKSKLAARPEGPKNVYDLTKVWTLQGTLEYSVGLHALILDRAQPDKEARKPHTTYDVMVGDFIRGEDKPRIYEVEILDVQKNYVKYYRHDMEDATEDERTFEMTVW